MANFDLKAHCSLLRYFFNQMNARNEVATIMMSKCQFFKPGKYKMIHLGKTIVYRGRVAETFLKNQALDCSKSLPIAKLRVKQLMSNAFTIQMHGAMTSEYVGDFALFTQGGDIKIFDTTNNVVLHFLRDSLEYNRLKVNHEVFSTFFLTPVIDFRPKQQLVIELMVNYKAPSSWKDDEYGMVLEKFFLSYVRYLRACSHTSKVRRSTLADRWSISDELKNRVATLDYSYIIHLETTEWPYVQSHGDFWSGNVLLDNGQSYIIDWEYSAEHVFFYDLLHFMLLQVLKMDDFSLLDAYFEGVYDEHMTRLFEAVGLTYLADKKDVYLMISIAERVSKSGSLGDWQQRFLGLLETIHNRYVLANRKD